MGKPTGFMDYKREDAAAFSVEERIKNFNEFHTPLSKEEQQKQGARCMDCGVPFCQAGMKIGNAFSGCPLNNLIPEWNDLIYSKLAFVCLRLCTLKSSGRLFAFRISLNLYVNVLGHIGLPLGWRNR